VGFINTLDGIMNNFEKLAKIDVGNYVEKKQNLSYLSWAWAVDQLMRADPMANWTFNRPEAFGETLMVSCTVTAFGKPVTMHLPVMDHRNQAIKNPDAFAVNKNMMRCLVKAIACHGLGLYIYAGEDVPMEPEPQPRTQDELVAMVSSAKNTEELKQIWTTLTKPERESVKVIVGQLGEQLKGKA
jgi:hypothetical protein